MWLIRVQMSAPRPAPGREPGLPEPCSQQRVVAGTAPKQLESEAENRLLEGLLHIFWFLGPRFFEGGPLRLGNRAHTRTGAAHQLPLSLRLHKCVQTAVMIGGIQRSVFVTSIGVVVLIGDERRVTVEFDVDV